MVLRLIYSADHGPRPSSQAAALSETPRGPEPPKEKRPSDNSAAEIPNSLFPCDSCPDAV